MHELGVAALLAQGRGPLPNLGLQAPPPDEGVVDVELHEECQDGDSDGTEEGEHNDLEHRQENPPALLAGLRQGLVVPIVLLVKQGVLSFEPGCDQGTLPKLQRRKIMLPRRLFLCNRRGGHVFRHVFRVALLGGGSVCAQGLGVVLPNLCGALLRRLRPHRHLRLAAVPQDEALRGAFVRHQPRPQQCDELQQMPRHAELCPDVCGASAAEWDAADHAKAQEHP
mmetsp:Transcript_69783/g.226971  ORF Transcript_69783/g.226971 Transcript_69783/m.226971 type:complete len:225 (+) Transcript_69783:1335-2009(+)